LAVCSAAFFNSRNAANPHRKRLAQIDPWIYVLMGETALQKTRNTARNIEEGRTHPVQVICRKPR